MSGNKYESFVGVEDGGAEDDLYEGGPAEDEADELEDDIAEIDLDAAPMSAADMFISENQPDIEEFVTDRMDLSQTLSLGNRVYNDYSSDYFTRNDSETLRKVVRDIDIIKTLLLKMNSQITSTKNDVEKLRYAARR